MPSSVTDRDRAAAAGFAAALATLAGALLLILALGASALFVVEIFARLGSGSGLLASDQLDAATRYLSFAFAAASLLALPAGLAAPFVRTGDPPRRSHSALALVPGCLAAVIVWLVALAAAAILAPDRGLDLVLGRSAAAISSYVFLFLPLALAVAAALGGARTPEATAAAAAPLILAGAAGYFGELSITQLLLAVVLPLLVAAAAFAILYAAAPARAITPWLTGIALACGTALFTATGLLTPSEAVALIALFALPIAVLVRTLALRQPIGPILRQLATEMVSLIAIFTAAIAAWTALLLAGAGSVSADAIGSGTTIRAVLCAAFLVASYLLTPLLALGLALPLVLATLRSAQLDPIAGTSILILLGLAAIAARAARRDPPLAQAGLPPHAAGAATATFVALAFIYALKPEFGLALMRALLQ